MKYIQLIYIALLMSSNIYAMEDIKKICPEPVSVNREAADNSGHFAYSGRDSFGRMLKDDSRFYNHLGDKFYNFTVESLNLFLSKYDEVSKKLTCAYDIHITDAGNGTDMGYDYALLRPSE